MRHARQRSLALLICLVFSTLELLSAAPALHRHGEGADLFLRPAGSPAVSAAGASAGPALGLPSGEHDRQAPRECPACAISGLFAIASYGAPVVAPATHSHHTASLDVRAAASPVIASLRGRAPPLA
jgi:hypothetical protein